MIYNRNKNGKFAKKETINYAEHKVNEELKLLLKNQTEIKQYVDKTKNEHKNRFEKIKDNEEYKNMENLAQALLQKESEDRGERKNTNKVNLVVQKVIDNWTSSPPKSENVYTIILNEAEKIKLNELEEKYITNNKLNFEDLFESCKNTYELAKCKTNIFDDFTKLLLKDKIDELFAKKLHDKFYEKINKIHDNKLVKLINGRTSVEKPILNVKQYDSPKIKKYPDIKESEIKESDWYDINNKFKLSDEDVLEISETVKNATDKPSQNIQKQFEVLDNAIASATKKYWQAKRELMIVTKIIEKTYNDVQLLDNDKDILDKLIDKQ